MLTRACLGTAFGLALGCSATATSNPALRQLDDGGASGSSSSAGSTSAGGSPGAGGAPSADGGSATGAGAGQSSTAHGGSGSSLGGAGSTSGGSGNSGPVTVGLPFSEDFESGMLSSKLWTAVANQVPDSTNAQWSVVADETGKAAQLNADGTERFLVGGNGAWTDQKLELRVKVVSGSPEIDIAFRYHALKEYYYLEFANAHFKVRDRTSANSDILPAANKPALVVGTWYKLTLQIKGTAVTAALDDMVTASGSFSSMPIAAGGIAIGVGSGSGVVLFDDIHVTAP